MKNTQYHLQDFNIFDTPCTYPVICKGEAAVGETLVKVYIDNLSGFIIDSDAVCVRLSGSLTGESEIKTIDTISTKLGINQTESESLFREYIHPSIIDSNFEYLSSFFTLENFNLSKADIVCNFSNGFTQGTAVLHKSNDPTIQIHASWIILENAIDVNSIELIGAHTANIYKNKYVNILLNDLVALHVNNHLKTVG